MRFSIKHFFGISNVLSFDYNKHFASESYVPTVISAVLFHIWHIVICQIIVSGLLALKELPPMYYNVKHIVDNRYQLATLSKFEKDN